MAEADPPSLSIWAVSDGRAGIEAQVLGLAEALARRRPAQVTVKRIGWKAGLARLPWRLNFAPRLTLKDPNALAPPWPDVWIAAGRATLPLSTRMRRWSDGRTFVVQLQDPKTDLAPFDLVIPPTHDRLKGDNVFPILGAPNRVTPERLAADRARFAAFIDPLPTPRIAVIIGGRSRAHDLPPARAAEIGRDLAALAASTGGVLMVSFTRRTPAAAQAIVRRALASVPSLVWDNQGENPYFAFLAAADAILVTGESTNLATDAAATGKPVFILDLPGSSEKFRRFHADLQGRGASRPFIGGLGSWAYDPLRETDRAAAHLLGCYDTEISR